MTIEGDVELARREGVADPADLPFLLEPATPAGAGVVLVHGFTASPWEMRRTARDLAEAGFVALGIRLPGHGTTAEDLAGRRMEEWLTAVARGRRMLADRGLRVYGVGQSTGALLLLALAAEQPLAGLVLLSPFLRLRQPLAPLAGLLRFVHPFQRQPAPAPHYYDRRPLAGVWQIVRLLRLVRRQLPCITVPVRIVGAPRDRTIRPKSTDELFRRLGSRHKELRRLGPEATHALVTPENPCWREAIALTVGFLRDLEFRNGR